jgi:hypothetical protein
VRGSAAHAIGAVGDESVVEELLNCLDNEENPLVCAAALDASIGKMRSWPDKLAMLITSGRATRLPPPVKGKLIEALQKFVPTDAATEWLDWIARNDNDFASRTAATKALESHGKLSDSNIKFLIDPALKRKSGRSRDTDHGVKGQVAAAVLGRFANGNKPDEPLFNLVVSMLTEQETHRAVLTSALAPLATLELNDAKRLLSSLEDKIANSNASTALQRLLDSHRQYIDTRLSCIKEFEEAQKKPEVLLEFLRNSQVIWLEQRGDVMTSVSALLVTANIREGRTVYRTLCETCKHEKLPIKTVGSRIVHCCELISEDGNKRPVFLAQLTDIGPLPVQAMFNELYHELEPGIIMYVGCCGGLPEKSSKAKEGTVVVACQASIMIGVLTEMGKSCTISQPTRHRVGFSISYVH